MLSPDHRHGPDWGGFVPSPSWLGSAQREPQPCQQGNVHGKKPPPWCLEKKTQIVLCTALTTGQTTYAADILGLLVLGLSKITSSLFYETLFSQLHLRLIRSTLISMVLWTILSVILVGVRCSDQPWFDIGASQCSSLVSLFCRQTYQLFTLRNKVVNFLTHILRYLLIKCTRSSRAGSR